MSGITAWLLQLEWERLLVLLITAAAAVVSITLHEVSHGLAALALGDPTARSQGRLSLNPLKHLDLWGLAMLIFAKVGWAKPVPVDVRYFRNPRLGMALVSVAGPLSNVLLSALAAACYTASVFAAICLEQPWLEWVAVFFSSVFHISAGLAVFNLLPVPPLDGSKVVFGLLPRQWYFKLMHFERWGMLLLMALLLTGVLDVPLNFLRGALTDFLTPVSGWTLELLNAFFIG